MNEKVKEILGFVVGFALSDIEQVLARLVPWVKWVLMPLIALEVFGAYGHLREEIAEARLCKAKYKGMKPGRLDTFRQKDIPLLRERRESCTYQILSLRDDQLFNKRWGIGYGNEILGI